MLCSSCQDIFRTYRALKETHIHHENAYSLQQQAEEGCHLCTLLWEQFDESKQLRILANEPPKYNGHKPHHNRTEYNLTKTSNSYSLSYKHPRLDYTNSMKLCPTHEVKSSTTEHEGCDNTGSEASWKIASQWIEQCSKNHSKCKASLTKDNFFPTRLVDVGLSGSSDAPKLYVSDGAESGCIEYLTLSHCWGKNQIFRLLKTNIDQLRERIPTKQLSQTFQQAITLTKRMGLRYIWIDSLCILQDSEDDWQYESSRMGDVYKHSFCNISATAAEDGRSGLFFHRDPLLISPCEIAVAPKSPAGLTEEIYRIIDTNLWVREIDEAPLNSRGWVFQERFLAPRKLNFGARQLFWECAEFRASESFPEGLPKAVKSDEFRVSDERELERLFSQAKKNKTDDKLRATQLWLTLVTGSEPFAMKGDAFRTNNGNEGLKLTPNAYRLWTTVITHYARKHLTKEQDKLVALSGVVKWYQGLFKDDEYLAGHWKSHLINQLLWEVSPNTASYRPQNYRAPSWSWASVEGRVGFRDILELDSQNLLAHVIDAQVKSRPGDRTGAVLSGFIKIKGKVISVAWESGSFRTERQFDARLENGRVSGFSDVKGKQFLPDRSVCLPIQAKFSSTGNPPFSSTLEGLVLEAHGHTAGRYRRIGWFASHDDGARSLKETWDGLEEHDVVII